MSASTSKALCLGVSEPKKISSLFREKHTLCVTDEANKLLTNKMKNIFKEICKILADADEFSP